MVDYVKPTGTPTALAGIDYTDSTWDRVVQRLTDPDDDGTPHEPGEGACDIVHVVRGIGGAPDDPPSWREPPGTTARRSGSRSRGATT